MVEEALVCELTRQWAYAGGHHASDQIYNLAVNNRKWLRIGYQLR